jgi:hypothetical protein
MIFPAKKVVHICEATQRPTICLWGLTDRCCATCDRRNECENVNASIKRPLPCAAGLEEGCPFLRSIRRRTRTCP